MATTSRTDAVDREMHVPGMFNLRDLGGLPVQGGGTVRPGLLMRSGELSGLQAEGAAMFAELGLRTVVDLRTIDEAQARPDVLDGLTATLHVIPLLSLSYNEIPPNQRDLYAFFADFCMTETARVVKVLAAPNALPGLFHCAVGKDRTGIVASVVLSQIGVSDDEIVADFLLSNQGLGLPREPGVRNVAAAKVTEATPVYDMLLSARHEVSAELITGFLAQVRESHGSVTDYLRSGGVTDDELTTLEAALVDRD